MQTSSLNSKLDIVLTAFTHKHPIHSEGVIELPPDFQIDNNDLYQIINKLYKDGYLEKLPSNTGRGHFWLITLEGSLFAESGGYVAAEKLATKFEKIIESIPDLTKVTSYILTIAVIFGIAQHLVFYQLMLKIPIFSFVGVSEYVLNGGSRTIPMAIFLSIIYGALTVSYSDGVLRIKNQIWSLIIIGAGVGLIELMGFFDPLLKFTLNNPITSIYYIAGIAIFVLALMIYLNIKRLHLKVFVDSNWMFVIIVLTIWYGLYFGAGNFNYIKSGAPGQTVVVKLKGGIILDKKRHFIYAGRTEKYWFFYNTNLKYTRIIKEDDIDISEYR